MRRKTKNGQKTGGALKRTRISPLYIYILGRITPTDENHHFSEG
jgi:hypothetical protein